MATTNNTPSPEAVAEFYRTAAEMHQWHPEPDYPAPAPSPEAVAEFHRVANETRRLTVTPLPSNGDIDALADMLDTRVVDDGTDQARVCLRALSIYWAEETAPGTDDAGWEWRCGPQSGGVETLEGVQLLTRTLEEMGA